MNSIDPKEISRYPKVIKDAQMDAVHLDILVCGKCHSAFHFVEDFQIHKDHECTNSSPLRENFANEPKSQVWGFLLWKNSRQRLENNKNSWAMYQMWCKLEEHTREGWITAGKNVQFFSNIGLGKMQEFKYSSKNGGDHDNYNSAKGQNDTNITVVNTNNSLILPHSDVDTEEDIDGDHSFPTSKSIIKNNESLIIRTEDESEKMLSNRNSTIPFAKRTRKNTGVLEERNVEKIIGKTWNHKRKRYEYLIKWEGLSGENNTWEPLENLDTCKRLIDEFEKLYVKKTNKQSSGVNSNSMMPIKDRKNQLMDKSNELAEERPQRSSKKKALNMVKAWCGNISDKDDIVEKRKHLDDDDDEYKNVSNSEVSVKKAKSEIFSDNDDDDDSEWSGGEDIGSDEEGRNCTYASNKKSKSKFSILEATMLNKPKMNELQQQNTGLSSRATITTMPGIRNEQGNKLQQHVLPHTIAKGNIQSGIYATAKKLPKNQAQKNRDQVRIIQRGSRIRSGIFKLNSASSVKPMAVNGLQSSNRYLTGSSIFKPKNSATMNNKLFTSTSNVKSSTTRSATPMKILPTSALSLTSTKQSILPTSSISLSNTNININTSTNSNDSIFLNQNDGEKIILENGLQLSKSDLKDNQNETSLESFTDASGNIMLKDEDGTIYQLAGHDENGQTVLLAQGSNGEQQCLLLSTDENSKILDDTNEQLKNDHEQELHIETDNTNSTEMIMDNLILKSSGDADDQSPGVVAHVLKAESPSPGGTRKLTLLLTDGTCMVAGINKEQYDTLGFDK